MTTTDDVDGTGTPTDPWQLTTPPGSSAFEAYRDPDADPPALVVQVGKTQLRYHLSCIEDLHAMLAEYGDWMPLGSADEQKDAAPGTVEAWGRSADNPVGGWYGFKKGLRGRFGNYLPPVLEALGLAEVEHNPGTTGCGRSDVANGHHVSRSIDAPAHTVWGLLTDSSTYPAWNPSVISIEGSIVAGSSIKLVSIASPTRTFKLKVASMEPPRRMVWASGMPLGLFKGVRTFLLQEEGARTNFSITEEFTGPLSGLIARSIPDLTDSFDQFADGLKTAAEGQKGTP